MTHPTPWSCVSVDGVVYIQDNDGETVLQLRSPGAYQLACLIVTAVNAFYDTEESE